MAQGTFEGGVISIRGDASQVKEELSEVSKLLTELEKNKVKLKPEIDINNVKKDINKLEQYMQGRFGALDFSKIYSSLMKTASRNPNDFVKQLERTMHGVNLLDQTVKPEDISKLAAASAEEISELINGLGKLAPSTKATGTPVTKRLQALYDKYPNGIEGLNGSGKGGGFGASEEALNRIGDTLDRIDANVQGITESIRNGTGTLKAASQDAEKYAGSMEKAETAANKMQTAVEKMKQKQQSVKNALEGEKVEADWDWTLQYLNGAKNPTQKKVSKPKTQVPEPQPEIRTSAPDVTPIKKVVKAEEELRNAAEGATDALKAQGNEIPQINNSDIFASNATANAVEDVKELSQAQAELGNNVQTTTERLQEQNQVLQKTNDSSVAKEYGLQELVQRSGDLDNIQQYVYTIDEAEAKLKEITSKHANKKDEAKQLDPSEAREVWGALNSLDQISLFGSDEEVERVNQIFDQYEEWVERYVTQDPLKTNGLDKMSTLFERINEYRNVFNKTNSLDQSRELYNLDIGQRSAIMTPDQTIEGYSYVLDRVKVILETMEQYKTAIEEAQAKGQEITEEDQKFLDNYDKTKTQWTRAGERAQTNLDSLQEQKRLAEEDKKRIEQRKQDEKERRILRNQLQREDRQTRIEDDQQFETAFQEYKIDDIKNMGLDEIEKRITQMEESKKKGEELRNELIQLKKNIKANDSYKEGKLDEEVIDAMRPTEQEEEWLALYDEQAKKRKEYAQELKKQKNEIKKKQEKEIKAEAAKSQTDEDTKQAQNNADQAQEAADKAKKAADESEDAVKRANDAQKKNEKENTEKEDKKPVTESTSANQTAQKNVKYVTRTKEQLQAQLTMAEQSVVNYKEKQEQLQKEIESIQNKTFDVNGQEWGNAKTAEEFLANKLIEDNAELEKVNANLTKKENSVKNLLGRIKQIESWKEQGFDIQLKEKSPKTTVKKKIAIAGSISGKTAQASSSDTINIQIEEEKKDGEAVSKLKDETQNTNNKLQETKELTDEQSQLLDALFNKDDKKGSSDNNGLGNENNSFTSLIESLKNLPAATKILSEFDAVNSNISKNAQGAADAIQAEANAFSSMTQATQGVNSKQLITSDKRDAGLLEIGSTGNELKEIEQKKDQYKQITDQIKTIEDGRAQAEEEITRHNISDKNFKVGRSKNKAYDLIKTYAEQLKQDYESYEKLDPNDTSDKAKEIIAKYENPRVAYEKAFSKMMSLGIPKDKGDESVGFRELSNKHGVGSEGFDEAEKHVADNLKFLEERLNQQKQQTEIVLNKLYAERDRLQQELTSPSSQTNVLANGNNLPADKPDLGGGQSANGIRTEGDEAGNAVANMQALVQAKKEVTEANQKLSQSAQQTTDSLNGEAGAGTNTSEALQQEIDALKQVSEQQKKTIDEQKQAIDDLQKKQEQATNEKIANLQKENEALIAQQQKELEQRRQAELDTQKAIELQKKQFEEDEKVRKEQEAKAAQKAEERAKKAEENARIKSEDKDFSKLYTEYGKDYSAILDAKSVQEFDAAVAHLTETERLFWEARMLQAGGSAYAHQADMLKQNDLPEGYEKSVDNQTAVLKQREMAIAEYTANVIAELEKQEAAFEKMDTVYKTATDNPNHARKDFIDASLIDRNQTQKYTYAIDDVTKSLQRMREIVQSMKDGTFDFGNIDALRELFELRQNLPNQMSTAKDVDKAYKEAQGQIEAESVKKTEQYKTVLTGLEKQIEKIQTASKTLINPDSEYKTELEGAKELLATIQTMIEELNANPLQFMGKDGDKNAKVIQSTIDGFKEGIGQFQEDFQSQQGIQGLINTYFTSYKGAYTSFFREIKDSFKSQALGELQKEINRTFTTFEDSIVNLNRATGLNQGEFLDKYLNTNGGKATAGQNEQQQKVRNAIAENYRGLITDISDELTKVESRMSGVLGEKFLDQDYFQNFSKVFTAGLGDATEFKAFQNNAESAVQSLSKLKNIQEQMASGQLDLTQLAPDKLKKQIQEIVELFANLNEKYKDVTNAAKEFAFADEGDIERQRASIAQFLKSNQGISSDAKIKLQEYFNQLQQGISQADLKKLKDGWHQVADAEQAANRTGATFMSELQTRFKSLSAYLLSFVSFYRVIGVFKDGINIIHELDDALTEMNKVSTESLASLKDYQKESFGVANDVGTTATQLQQSTADFVRLGESFQEAKESARVANELLTVSEFDNIQDATTALTAISAAYEDTANGLDKQAIIDKLNKIGDEYAISTDGLATALQDSASALTTANNDMDEAAALIAAGVTKYA